MKLTLKTLKGKEFHIDAEPTDTVSRAALALCAKRFRMLQDLARSAASTVPSTPVPLLFTVRRLRL
jgi:hypothetical protein